MERPFPQRLSHHVPGWVKTGAVFHIRIRTAAGQSVPLTDPALAGELLTAVRRYHDTGRWWCRLVMLMPDHLHAILSFPEGVGMASTVRDWKRVTARFHGVCWQSNFFDHRVRSESEADQTWIYIENNPVAKGLIEKAGDWSWRWSP